MQALDLAVQESAQKSEIEPNLSCISEQDGSLQLWKCITGAAVSEDGIGSSQFGQPVRAAPVRAEGKN